MSEKIYTIDEIKKILIDEIKKILMDLKNMK